MIDKQKLRTLSMNTLRELNALVVEVIKEKRDAETRQKRWTMSPGDGVRFYHSKLGRWVQGRISEIKIKKATVLERRDNDLPPFSWNVPLSMLEAYDPNKPGATEGIPSF